MVRYREKDGKGRIPLASVFSGPRRGVIASDKTLKLLIGMTFALKLGKITVSSRNYSYVKVKVYC